jgi:hypothetical protein
MVSQRAREQVSFARTLEQALLGLGKQVYRGPIDVGPADLVLGGVSSPISPGATYALVALERIGQALTEGTPLLLFVDDPRLDKIRSGALSVMRDESRLYTGFLMSKRVKQSHHLTDTQKQHIRIAVEMLAGTEWPPVLVPLHPWASTAIAAKRLGIVTDVIGLDVSAVIEVFAPPVPEPAAKIWLTDRHYSDQTLPTERVLWPVIPIDSMAIPDVVRVYSVARGIHQGTIARMPGWWTPTPLYVAEAGVVFLPGYEESQAIGTHTPYYLTPDVVEMLDDAGYRDLADQQADYLKETMWDSSTLSSHLMDSLGRVSSSRKRATTSRKPRT